MNDNTMFEVEDSWYSVESPEEKQLHYALFGSFRATAKPRASKKKRKVPKLLETPAGSFTGIREGKCFEQSRAVGAGKKRKLGGKRQTTESRRSERDDGDCVTPKPKRRKKEIDQSHLDSEKESACKRLKKKRKSDTEEVKEELHRAVLSKGPSKPVPVSMTTDFKRAPCGSKLHSKMASKMEGARFRWLNEQLYTTTGAKAKEMFEEDPRLFEVYHKGFSTQVSKWPINPLDRVIEEVKSLPKGTVVADFGCGEARLARSVPHTVHSFDLVAVNSYVTACDMAHTPLKSSSVDVCLFCLALMGTNIADFIREARRVLRVGGQLRIVDIASRFASVADFVRDVEVFGFELVCQETIGKMFVSLQFKRAIQKRLPAKLPDIQLKPCTYKKR